MKDFKKMTTKKLSELIYIYIIGLSAMLIKPNYNEDEWMKLAKELKEIEIEFYNRKNYKKHIDKIPDLTQCAYCGDLEKTTLMEKTNLGKLCPKCQKHWKEKLNFRPSKV